MKKRCKYYPWLGFDDRWLMLVGIPVISILMPVAFFRVSLGEEFWGRWLISAMYTVAYWLSSRYVFIFVRKKYPHLSQIARRLVLTGGMILINFVVINFLLGIVDCNLLQISCDTEDSWKYVGPSLVIIALVSTIYESVYLYYQLRVSIEEREQLKRENIESQLEGLRNQVNPHFLFNSLNTLTYLIPEDPDKAVEFVRRLSHTYRYILEIRDKKLVTLKEELQFLEAYRFLVQERFGDKLRIETDIPAALEDRHVISLALQMLLENAVKHNIISQSKPLKIKLFIKNEQLVVRNNLQPRQQSQPSTGTGLENIRHRYQFFTQQQVQVKASEGFFEVRLPLLELV